MWQFAVGIVGGLLIGEYYRRIGDTIRKEQLADQREQRREPERLRMREIPVFDAVEHPQPRRERTRPPLITEEHEAEFRATGHTGGRRMGMQA